MKDWNGNRSLFDGVRDVASSTVFGTVLRPYWREILIVLLLIVVIGGVSRVIASNEKARILGVQLEQQRVRFEHLIGEKDKEREAVEQEFTQHMAEMKKDYEKTKLAYSERLAARAKWKRPPDILRATKRFRALGYDALMHKRDCE